MESIIFSTQIATDLDRYLKTKNFSKLGLIADQNTFNACYPLIQEILPKHEHFQFQAGEGNKNLQTCISIWEWMTDCAFDRKSLIINLGGGVTGDMGGFCASTYKRGIRFVNIPTTLLSQVDASVGGKLGVDFNGFKNHIGVFNEPEAVIISDAFLKTLPLPELRSGYAEVIKHGLIMNENYFHSLKSHNWETQKWKDIIEKSVSIKKEVVEKDPKEEGLRKILNFGHTVGHAVESFYLGSKYHLLHGEAIAIGMIAEAYLSRQHIGFSQEGLDTIIETLLSIFGKVNIPSEDLEAIAQLCFQDKKNEGKTINCSLLKKIGSCDYNIAVSQEDIINSLNFYNTIHK
ncbi:3-dehydroquinate synthase [Echinicola jeungdonensis]|uniref:3-dehydroquinate synthase n=1 Tax=Echinicola jeungdonensis TaxID=709343 RepID=A0ABV5J0U9_9BACT|nr:3-dehydroquinate synthase [Echinicola jeungdonensis]MDN3668286.1 3-dehydroquinate synthase [Echinicola jeungdonensis]